MFVSHLADGVRLSSIVILRAITSGVSESLLTYLVSSFGIDLYCKAAKVSVNA